MPKRWRKKRHLGGNGTCEGTSYQKGKKEMVSLFDKFVTEGNEKACDLAKAGAMMDDGFIAEARAKTVQQEREEVYEAL